MGDKEGGRREEKERMKSGNMKDNGEGEKEIRNWKRGRTRRKRIK